MSQSFALVRPVVLFDERCRFCRWSARMIERLDRKRRLAFLPLGDPRADVLLASVAPERRRVHFWLVERDGNLAGGGDAAVRLLSLLGAAPLAELSGIKPLVGRGYDLVSSVRGALGRVVPDGPGPRRFP